MSKKVKRTWVVENTWKCDSCNSSNKGRYMKCQNCGNPKEKHEKYNIDENLTALAVTDPAMLAQAKAGKNWECDYCGGSVRNLHGECNTCGGPKIEPEIFSQPYNNQQLHNQQPNKKENVTGRRRRLLATICLTLAVMMTIIGLAIFLFLPHDEQVSVINTEWVYTANLQQRTTRTGSDWDENVPASAFNNVCHTKQRTTRNCRPYDCNPHQVEYDCNPHDCRCSSSCSDNNNGYSTCRETCSTCYDSCYRIEHDTCYHQCPVIDEWCSYNYYEWPTIHTETRSGNNHNMEDPDLHIQPNSSSPQRIVHERYFSVVFSNEGDTWSYVPNSTEDYNRFEVGAEWLIEVNRIGEVSPLHPIH